MRNTETRYTLPMLQFGLLTLLACGSPEPTPAEPLITAQTPAPAPAPAPAPPGLCPPDLSDLSSWRPIEPYVPTAPNCVRFQERKSGECSEAILAAILALPPEDADPSSGLTMSPLHLDAQCQCVPERQAAVSGCAGAADCGTFARCAVNLLRDGWRPGP